MESFDRQLEQKESPKQLTFSGLNEKIINDIVDIYIRIVGVDPEIAHDLVTVEKVKRSLLQLSTAAYRLGSNVLGDMNTKLRFDFGSEISGSDYLVKVSLFPNVDKTKEIEGRALSQAFEKALQEYLAAT